MQGQQAAVIGGVQRQNSRASHQNRGPDPLLGNPAGQQSSVGGGKEQDAHAAPHVAAIGQRKFRRVQGQQHGDGAAAEHRQPPQVQNLPL